MLKNDLATKELLNDSNKEPLVSICCQTYNHKDFIAQAIESFLMQKTNFRFEILLRDDASTDGTTEIVKEYANKFPDIINPLIYKENQWAKGISPFMDNVKRARGKYIALCEGDDYWTDPLKLQKQVDFLEANPEYIAIANNGIVKNHITKEEYLFNSDEEHDITIEELIIKRRFPTASVLFLSSAIKNIQNEINIIFDTILWCYLASKGKFKYIPTVSSVYNRGLQGVVESTEPLTWAKTVEKWQKEIIKQFSNYYNTSISKEHIWTHYFRVYKQYNKEYFFRSYYALFKCYKYDFRKTASYQLTNKKNRIKNIIKKI